jgi:hypothetical protein
MVERLFFPSMLIAYCIIVNLWHPILQLCTGSWLSTRCVGSFRQLLDLLGIFPTAHCSYNPVLADMASLVPSV